METELCGCAHSSSWVLYLLILELHLAPKGRFQVNPKLVFCFGSVPCRRALEDFCLRINEKVNVNNHFQCFIVCEQGEPGEKGNWMGVCGHDLEMKMNCSVSHFTQV